MTQIVHQVRYAWTESSLLGTRGMGPVESTLPPDELRGWDRRLRGHVWAVDPTPGYTFISCDAVGVLVRKVTTTSDGRADSAARVLLSEGLTARGALGLTMWREWELADIEVLDWTALGQEAERGLNDLRDRARTVPPARLATLFAQLLTAPADQFTVIGEPDPAVVVCALGDMIGQTPTFATDESDDTAPDLPAAVFLRKAPVSTTSATRRRLSQSAPPSDPLLASFSGAVAEAYTADGLAGIAAIARDRPPASAEQARDWARESQFAPGVLADLARLPRLDDIVLNDLTKPDAVERITAVTAIAPDAQLAEALDRRLPAVIALPLLREALRRIYRGASQPLLGRLASLGPLSTRVVATPPWQSFDQFVRVSRELFAPDQRRAVLEQTAEQVPVAELIRSVADHAGPDPEGAVALFSALCARAPLAAPADIATLQACAMLAGPVRQFAGSEQRASAYLMTLLRALPEDAVVPDFVAGLDGRGDPALLHALDTIAVTPALREQIQQQIRLRFYHEHELHAPMPLEPEGGPASPEDTGRRRWPGRRSSHRKAT